MVSTIETTPGHPRPFCRSAITQSVRGSLFRRALNQFDGIIWIKPTKRTKQRDFKEPIVDVLVNDAFIVTEHAAIEVGKRDSQYIKTAMPPELFVRCFRPERRELSGPACA